MLKLFFFFSIDIFKYFDIIDYMEQQTVTDVFKALSDDARISIVRVLAQSDVPVSNCDIVAKCQALSSLSQPAVSHHFNKLVRAGIVKEQRQGTQKTYLLSHETLTSAGIDATRI